MTYFINNDEYIYNLINDETDDELTLDANEKYFYDIINNNNKNEEIKEDGHEILIQENDKFIVTKKLNKYGSQIKILYELLVFRQYRFIFKYHYDGNYSIYTLFKKIGNNCIYILLADGQCLYNRLKKIINNRDKSYNNIILCICANGIYTKNDDKQYQFLKLHDRVRICDKFIEKMEYDLINNDNNDNLRIGYLFFNYGYNGF